MQKHPSPGCTNELRLSFALAACVLALAACGGGGGDSGGSGGSVQPPAPILVNPALALQGFWSGPVTAAPDAATRSSAIVMPDGTSWIVFENDGAPTAVARIQLTASAVNGTDATVTGSGNYYRLGTVTRSTASESGTASTNGTFTGTVAVAGNAATRFNWVSAAGFTTQSVAADVVGTWNGTGGFGAAQVSWAISSTGAVSGNSSAGCIYAGTLRPSTGTAVYEVSVVEDCSSTGGPVRNMSGIAILAGTNLGTTRNALRVVFTADAGTTGGLFALSRQ